jgi:uncharacterized protein YbcI
MSEAPTPPAGAHDHDVLSEVCSGAAALFRSHWGRGPRKCRAHWAGPDTILVLLENGLTEAERTLAAAGRGEDVLAGRRALNALVEPQLRAIVQDATGRPVEVFLGSSRLEPDVTAEVFVLGPA